MATNRNMIIFKQTETMNFGQFQFQVKKSAILIKSQQILNKNTLRPPKYRLGNRLHSLEATFKFYFAKSIATSIFFFVFSFFEIIFLNFFFELKFFLNFFQVQQIKLSLPCLAFIHSFIYSFMHAFIYLFLHACIHSFFYSFFLKSLYACTFN